MIDMTFTDRTSWLAFRAEWRARYKDITAEIRATKAEMARCRQLRRKFGASADQYRYEADSMQSGLARERSIAGGMMRQLDYAKKRKNEMLAEAAASIAA